MAILLAQIALCGRAHMSKDKLGLRFVRQPLEVDTVPCWNCGGENRRAGTELLLCVVAYAESIAIVRSPGVQAET